MRDKKNCINDQIDLIEPLETGTDAKRAWQVLDFIAGQGVTGVRLTVETVDEGTVVLDIP